MSCDIGIIISTLVINPENTDNKKQALLSALKRIVPNKNEEKFYNSVLRFLNSSDYNIFLKLKLISFDLKSFIDKIKLNPTLEEYDDFIKRYESFICPLMKYYNELAEEELANKKIKININD